MCECLRTQFSCSALAQTLEGPNTTPCRTLHIFSQQRKNWPAHLCVRLAFGKDRGKNSSRLSHSGCRNWDDLNVMSALVTTWARRTNAQNVGSRKTKGGGGTPHSVDSTSILQNKELTKHYWEKMMSGEQDLMSFEEDTTKALKQQLRSQDNEQPAGGGGDSNNNHHESVAQNGESEPEKPAVNGNADDHHPMTNGVTLPLVIDTVPPPPAYVNGNHEESAIDMEVRLALEREAELRKERETVEQISKPAPELEEPLGSPLADSSLSSDLSSLEPPVSDPILEVDLKAPVSDGEPQPPLSPELDKEALREPEEVTEREFVVSPALSPVRSERVESPAYDVGDRSPRRMMSPPGQLPKTERPYANFTTESKIAMEIRELREREEELRQMRERLQMAAVLQNHQPVPEPVRYEENQVSGRDSPDDILVQQKEPLARAISLDSLQATQAYNTGFFMLGQRRKERITVRPLADGDEADKPAFHVLNESPIEREIRLAREREETLRKEKGLLEKNEANGVASSKNTGEPQPNKPKNLNLNLSNFGGNTQRFLATNRIQQEIEEQTQREIALRATGNIQTISQERTDSRVTQLGDVSGSSDRADGIHKQLKQSPSSESPTVNGYRGSSASSTNSMPPISRRFVPASGRGVSMQRFIASKGKEIAVSSATVVDSKPRVTSPPGNVILGNAVYEYCDIKPPQVRKAVKSETLRRGIPSAETKIQEELKEMKAREDELRRQRARLLGLSQPNLSILAGDTEPIGNGHVEKGFEKGHMGDRAISNPNLLENGDLPGQVEDPKPAVGGPRRRSALIAQWEQRIQKADVKS